MNEPKGLDGNCETSNFLSVQRPTFCPNDTRPCPLLEFFGMSPASIAAKPITYWYGNAQCGNKKRNEPQNVTYDCGEQRVGSTPCIIPKIRVATS